VALTERTTRRWTVADYHRAAEAGVFSAEERLELIEGEIYVMSPQLGPHATGCSLVEEALRDAFGSGWVVRAQKPLSLGQVSEPEPDVAVVRGAIRDFAREHPTTAVLVVEVADTTLRFDRGDKAELYARAGILDYWIVNLSVRRLEIRRDPDPATGEYRQLSTHGEDATVSPLAAPQASIAVRNLLP
jgi:Uma2 family endonuclease